MLDKYRFYSQKQKEIYKPFGKWIDFIKMIGKLLEEHDLKDKIIQKLQKENLELHQKNLELQILA